MSRDHYYIRRGPYLVPLDAEATEAHGRAPENEPVRIRLSRQRDVANHRRIMALCQIVLEQDGYYRIHRRADGSHSTTKIPHSIAFDALDEAAFQRIWRAYRRAICRHFLTDWDDEQLAQEVTRRLLGENERRRASG